MTRTRVYRAGRCAEENFDPEQISDHLEHGDCVVWLDVDSTSAADVALIANEFNLNPLAVEDATEGHQRPKVDRYDDHLFISLYDVNLDDSTGRLESHELALFVAPKYLITVRKSKGYSMDKVVERWDDNKNLGSYGVGYLLWGLLDVLVDGYFEIVEKLDERIESLEDVLFAPTVVSMQIQRQSYDMRKSLVQIRRIIVPTREVLNNLMRRDDQIVPAAMLPYYQDVYDHVLRAADTMDSLRDLVSTILETNLTIQGNRANEIMKKVTSWAAIAAVPTVVTGYYGMNVLTYPHAGTKVGGWVALGIMAIGVAGLYKLFRRMTWL
jgi:magnesium transporter